MKIPFGANLIDNVGVGRDLITEFENVAIRIGVETGMLVTVERYYHDIGGITSRCISRITFKVMDHEFDSLKDLTTALNNKAFL